VNLVFFKTCYKFKPGKQVVSSTIFGVFSTEKHGYNVKFGYLRKAQNVENQSVVDKFSLYIKNDFSKMAGCWYSYFT
jgi:hypothetical protein